MKMIKLLSAILIFVSSSAFAENVRFKTAVVEGRIVTNNLELTDIQAVMSCHFDFRGQRENSIRYPQTFFRKTSVSEYDIKVRPGSLTELFIPGFKLLTCAYKLILIGKNATTQRSAFGEVFLLGQESGVMTSQELRDVQDIDHVNTVLANRTKELSLSIDEKSAIIETPAID